LSEAQDNKEDIIDPLLLLKEYELNFEKDKIKIECVFGWDYDLVEENVMGGIHFLGEVIFRREGNAVVGRV